MSEVSRMSALSSRPIWVTDNDVDECPACFRAFSLVRRRHHCRQCGNVFCAACSAERVHLSYDLGYSKPQRRCLICKEIDRRLQKLVIDEASHRARVMRDHFIQTKSDLLRCVTFMLQHTPGGDPSAATALSRPPLPDTDASPAAAPPSNDSGSSVGAPLAPPATTTAAAAAAPAPSGGGGPCPPERVFEDPCLMGAFLAFYSLLSMPEKELVKDRRVGMRWLPGLFLREEAEEHFRERCVSVDFELLFSLLVRASLCEQVQEQLYRFNARAIARATSANGDKQLRNSLIEQAFTVEAPIGPSGESDAMEFPVGSVVNFCMSPDVHEGCVVEDPSLASPATPSSSALPVRASPAPTNSGEVTVMLFDGSHHQKEARGLRLSPFGNLRPALIRFASGDLGDVMPGSPHAPAVAPLSVRLAELNSGFLRALLMMCHHTTYALSCAESFSDPVLRWEAVKQQQCTLQQQSSGYLAQVSNTFFDGAALTCWLTGFCKLNLEEAVQTGEMLRHVGAIQPVRPDTWSAAVAGCTAQSHGSSGSVGSGVISPKASLERRGSRQGNLRGSRDCSEALFEGSEADTYRLKPGLFDALCDLLHLRLQRVHSPMSPGGDGGAHPLSVGQPVIAGGVSAFRNMEAVVLEVFSEGGEDLAKLQFLQSQATWVVPACDVRASPAARFLSVADINAADLAHHDVVELAAMFVDCVSPSVKDLASRLGFKTYKSVFVGTAALTWLTRAFPSLTTLECAAVCERLKFLRLFEQVSSDGVVSGFQERHYHRFVDASVRTVKRQVPEAFALGGWEAGDAFRQAAESATLRCAGAGGAQQAGRASVCDSLARTVPAESRASVCQSDRRYRSRQYGSSVRNVSFASDTAHSVLSTPCPSFSGGDAFEGVVLRRTDASPAWFLHVYVLTAEGELERHAPWVQVTTPTPLRQEPSEDSKSSRIVEPGMELQLASGAVNGHYKVNSDAGERWLKCSDVELARAEMASAPATDITCQESDCVPPSTIAIAGSWAFPMVMWDGQRQHLCCQTREERDKWVNLLA